VLFTTELALGAVSATLLLTDQWQVVTDKDLDCFVDDLIVLFIFFKRKLLMVNVLVAL